MTLPIPTLLPAPTMRRVLLTALAAGLVACGSDASPTPTERVVPPFGGTIFIDPDIITDDDPTTFVGLTYTGRAERTMYDRRFGWITIEPHLFDAEFDDGLTTEIQVNPEFGDSAAARVQAERYGDAVGRIPTSLRVDMETMWIHLGNEPFGGGNNNILVHTGLAEQYIRDGILEETLVHEGAHTSLDAYHATASGWLAAQEADGNFISTYARDHPLREDIAETLVPWVAVRYRSDRIDASLEAVILRTIPNRIAYLDGLGLNMYPIQ